MFTFHSGDTNTTSAPAIPVVAAWTETNGGDVNVALLSMDPPPDIKAGDSLLIFAYSGSSAVFGGVIPAGWEFLGFTPVNQSSVSIGVFYKKTATGSESAVTIVPSASTRMLGTYIRVTGANQTTLLDVSGYEDDLIDFAANPPVLTTTGDDRLALFGAVQSIGSGADVSLSGFSAGWAILDQDNTGLGAANMTSVFGFKEIPTAGSTGLCSVEFTEVGQTATFSLTIRPV